MTYRKKKKPKRKKSNNYIKYNSKSYKQWRSSVFNRDKFMCQMCGAHGSVQAHHIKRKYNFPELTLDINNGITLCNKCHYVVTGHEKIFEDYFHKIINKTLTLSYAESFFLFLINNHKDIVNSFVEYKKWDKIPNIIVRIVKRINISKKNKK